MSGHAAKQNIHFFFWKGNKIKLSKIVNQKIYVEIISQKILQRTSSLKFIFDSQQFQTSGHLQMPGHLKTKFKIHWLARGK